jgi:integrase
MLELAKRLRPGITTHGFRSTFRDWCGDEADAPEELAEHALAHKIGDATQRAYRRRKALKKRAVLMENWAAYCAGEVGGDNIVGLAGHA